MLLIAIDLRCGLKTIPVPCSTDQCQNQGFCYVDMFKNASQCVCPLGTFNSFSFSLFLNYLLKDSLANNVNMILMNANQVHVQVIVDVLIYRMVIDVFVVRKINH